MPKVSTQQPFPKQEIDLRRSVSKIADIVDRQILTLQVPRHDFETQEKENRKHTAGQVGAEPKVLDPELQPLVQSAPF
jgi:hypothetical protein